MQSSKRREQGKGIKTQINKLNAEFTLQEQKSFLRTYATCFKPAPSLFQYEKRPASLIDNSQKAFYTVNCKNGSAPQHQYN